MFIVQFGFTGISSKKGKLFGKHFEYPLRTTKFLFITVTHCPKATRLLVMDAMEGLARDSNWLIRNHAAIEQEKHDMTHELSQYYEDMYEKVIKADAATIERQRKAYSDLKNENIALRDAFTALNKGG